MYAPPPSLVAVQSVILPPVIEIVPSAKMPPPLFDAALLASVVPDRVTFPRLYTAPPLPAEHPIRQAAAETQGQVAVDSKGYIVYTNFAQREQNQFKDYVLIRL